MKINSFLQTKHLAFYVILLSFNSYCQENKTADEKISIEGIVLDNNKNPVHGVSIIEKNKNNGTSTDFNGKFKIETTKKSNLLIQFIGIHSLEYKVQESSNLIINIDSKVIQFCCSNHVPSHCTPHIKEMEKLSTRNNCTFE